LKETKIAKKLTDLIGNTPMLELSNYNRTKSRIIAKLEYFNPLGSVKDRVGIAMIEAAEKDGLLRDGSVIIEPTSGNTGIALAFAATVKGYRLILTMPDTMSVERRNMVKALGAEVVLTVGSKGMNGAIIKAEELCESTANSVILGQFDNPANPDIHRKTTALEILSDCPDVSIFIAGVGTGGTITGVGEALKEKNPNIKVIAVEPLSSPVLSGGSPSPHKIQGIGAGFVPKVMNTSVVDEIISVPDEMAFEEVKRVAKTEGLLVGISSGAALFAATEVASRPENHGKKIVVILPDTGERYLSTSLFD
jgi:cysteine synthase A